MAGLGRASEEGREQQRNGEQSGRARGEPIELLDLDWGSTAGTESPMRISCWATILGRREATNDESNEG